MSKGIITKEFVQTILAKRDKEIHKGDAGRILIVAGSEGMAGAAVLAARAALRCGSGLVQVCVPKELFPIVQMSVLEATCIERDFAKIDLQAYDAIAVGPGLGTKEDSVDAVKFVLQNYDGKIVLDADGLNIVAKENLFYLLSDKVVITPHIGEARRLLGLDKPEGQRSSMVTELWQKTKAVSVLKGKETLVATALGETYINTTGNPGMATAGSGDVLTGIIAGLMGQRKLGGYGNQRLSPSEAALCGVYIHGLAGDLAAKDLGEYGLVAGDLAYYTAIAIKNILE